MTPVRNIFAPKSSRILRVLLVDIGRDWDERELAAEAKVSVGLAHYVCKTMITSGYLSRNERNRIVVVDPVRLLRRWASYHEYDRMNKFLDYFTFEKEIDRFLDVLAALDQENALSGLGAR